MLYVLIPDTFTEPVATRTIVGYFELENIWRSAHKYEHEFQ